MSSLYLVVFCQCTLATLHFGLALYHSNYYAVPTGFPDCDKDLSCLGLANPSPLITSHSTGTLESKKGVPILKSLTLSSSMYHNPFYRPQSWEIMYLVASVRPSVSPSVCQFVCTLLAELFDL